LDIPHVAFAMALAAAWLVGFLTGYWVGSREG